MANSKPQSTKLNCKLQQFFFESFIYIFSAHTHMIHTHGETRRYTYGNTRVHIDRYDVEQERMHAKKKQIMQNAAFYTRLCIIYDRVAYAAYNLGWETFEDKKNKFNRSQFSFESRCKLRRLSSVRFGLLLIFFLVHISAS